MEKISVMIVDDEKLAIDDFLNMIDWEANGFKVVATAFNGRQALAKFQALQPQVVFSDIKMPYMDGIALIKNIRAISENTKIFLLTAYQDFAYAKSAITYGITDYIIKSEITTQYIQELLTKLKASIAQENEAADMLTQKTILDFLYSKSSAENNKNPLLLHKPYYYLIVEQDLPIDISAKNSKDYFRQQSTDLIGVLQRVEPETLSVVAINRLQMEQILIVIDTKEFSRSKKNAALDQYAAKIMEEINSHFKESFTIYVCKTGLTLSEVKKRMPDIQKNAIKVFWGTGRILPMFDVPLRIEKMQTSPDISMLDKGIERMDSAGTTEFIRDRLDQCLESYDYNRLRVFLRELYSVLNDYNLKMPKHDQLALGIADNQQFWYNGPDIRDWFIQKFDQLIEIRKRLHQNDYSKAILKAMDYVDEHFKEDSLSIQDIAEHVHLSVGHLCALFKKETGTTIKAFITHTRIEQAKQLLEESDRKIYDISEAVGYHSSQYFSQVFYRITGQYPSEYQKKG